MPVAIVNTGIFNNPFILGTTKPDATNTGYGVLGYTPATLTDVAGDVTITTNGTVYQGFRVHGAISIQASNVTVQGCEIVGRAGASFSSSLRGLITNVSGTGNVAQFNHLTQYDPSTSTDQSIYWREGFYLTGGSLTAIRNNVHDANHLSYITGGTHTLQGNYFHDPGFRNDDADHSTDATHPYWSHNDGTHIRGGTNHLVDGNSYEMKFSDLTGMNHSGGTNGNPNPNSAIEQVWPNCHGHLLQWANNNVTGVVSQRNWFKYGSVGYFFTSSTFTGGNITMTGNRFTPDQSKEFSQYVQVRVDPTTSWATILLDSSNVYSADPDTPSAVQGLPLTGNPSPNPTTSGTTEIWAYNVTTHTGAIPF